MDPDVGMCSGLYERQGDKYKKRVKGIAGMLAIALMVGVSAEAQRFSPFHLVMFTLASDTLCNGSR